jgi:Fe-S-cluster containining protein
MINKKEYYFDSNHNKATPDEATWLVSHSYSDNKLIEEKWIQLKKNNTLSKAEQECNIDVCKAVCCTFITKHEDQDTKDIRYYYSLHGVETKPDGRGGLWLKMPVPCKALDPQTLKCTVHENRPKICRVYPTFEGPFIKKNICNLLP